MRILPLSTAGSLTWAFVSCSQPNVMVVDSAGVVIAGASVQPFSMSLSGSPKLTDENGLVMIPEGGIQPTQWIGVRKAGHISSGQIDFDQLKPIQVVLCQ